jgi:hypothetical protein
MTIEPKLPVENFSSFFLSPTRPGSGVHVIYGVLLLVQLGSAAARSREQEAAFVFVKMNRSIRPLDAFYISIRVRYRSKQFLFVYMQQGGYTRRQSSTVRTKQLKMMTAMLTLLLACVLHTYFLSRPPHSFVASAHVAVFV